MSYTAHNFVNGTKLYAEQLNEIDAQVAENAAACETFTVGMVDGRIAQLTLSTDGSNIILSQNGVELTSVAIADINDIVFAEAFNVTSPLTLTLTDGDTSQITYTVSPSRAQSIISFNCVLSSMFFPETFSENHFSIS